LPGAAAKFFTMLLSFLSAVLLAGFMAPQELVTYEATLRAPSADSTQAEVVVSVSVADGWHLYDPSQDDSVPGVEAGIELGEGLEVAGPLSISAAPKPHIEELPSGMAVYQWLSGDFEMVQPVTVSGPSTEFTSTVTFAYQVCNDRLCHSPTKVDLPVTLVVQEEAFAEPAKAEPSSAQVSSQHFEATVSFSEAEVAQGETIKLIVDADIAWGWHIYAPEQSEKAVGVPIAANIVTEGFVQDGKLRSLGKVKSHMEDFGSGPIEYLWLEGEQRLEVEIGVAAEPGIYDVEVPLAWQVCDESVCLDEINETVTLKVTVLSGDADAAAKIGAQNSGERLINVRPEDALKDGFWALMIAAMFAGLATLLTPCVFPMIPITVSFFTKRAEAGKGTALGNATAYASGIVLTFVGLGIGAAALLGATGANQIASNPWLNLMIAGLFLVLAFSLLGFFEIQPPKFLANFASRAQTGGHSKSGYLPVVIMAFAFSVTAFTCTVGFVGGLLGLAATAGEWWYAAAAMTVYAVVFSMPFFFLALFPNMMQKMPSAGGWMNAVKVSFGYIEIIAAWKFLSSAERVWDLEILTRPVIIVLTIIPLLLWAGYMFGLYMTKGDYGQKPPRTLPRLAVGLLALASAGYIATGFPRNNYQGWVEAYFPPTDYGNPYGPLELIWEESISASIEKGREENSVVFLDFTGVTCVNCLRMEGNIFPVEAVASQIKTMVRGHLYVDKPPFGKENGAYQVETFGLASQPYYAVIDPISGDVLSTFNGYDPDAELFAKFLREGIEAGAARGLGPGVTSLTGGE